MSPLFTLISSLPFIFVFLTLLLSSYTTPPPPPPPPSQPLPNPHPPTLLPPAEFLPLPNPPRPYRYRTIPSSDLSQPPLTLFSNPAKTVARTSACVTVAAQAPNDAARPAQRLERSKAVVKKKKKKTTKKKKPKSVSFALENNTTRVVDRWIRKVRWARYDEVFDVDRWVEPHGSDQLHFPKTRFVGEGPDVEAVDDEGDVRMLDA